MSHPIHFSTELLDEVVRLGGFASPEAAAEAACKEYIAHHVPDRGYLGDPREIIELFGTIDFDPNYDYKAERMRDLQRIPTDENSEAR